MSASIFISFASQDRKVAMTLCSALEVRGFRCWISARDILPGENFQISIVRAIRDAKILLLVFTANSNKSEEMNKELALASQNKLIVVPLRVEDVAPNDAFAYEFATRQWIDFFADWEAAINQLAGRIGAALNSHGTTFGAPEEAPVLPAEPAPAMIAAPPPPAEIVPAEAPVAGKRQQARLAEPPEPPTYSPANDSDEITPARKPIKLYLGLSVAALLAIVIAGLIMPTLRRSPQPPAGDHATLSIQKAAPIELQTASIQTAAPDPTAADGLGNAAAADAKPAPVKRKKASEARKADDYVPY